VGVLRLLRHHIFSHSQLFNLNPLDIGYDLNVELALPLLELSDLILLKQGNAAIDYIDGALYVLLGLLAGLLLASTHDAHQGRENLRVQGNEVLFVRAQLQSHLELHFRVLQIREGAETSSALKGRNGCFLDGVRVEEGLDRVLVGTRGHQEVSCIDVHHWVLRVRQDQPLEVHKGEIVVS